VRDDRLDRLGELIAGYSLDLQPGEVVRIEGDDVAEPLLYSLYRAALKRGANPYLQVGIDRLSELKVAEGSDEQIAYVSQLEWDELELLDAVATVWAERNTRAFTNADSERYGRYLAARRELSQRGWERIASGDLRWCGTLQPVEAYAQDAEMSIEEYEDFVFGACHVTGEDDPVEHWLGVSAELERHASLLEQVQELRVVGPDTDLTLAVGGRRWQRADGHSNMPDGEVFTSPVESETRGEIRFGFPGVFEGREVADVRLRFDGGRVVASEASRGADFLRLLLEMDSGAAVLGELAFGLNYEIDRFTRNILFDEKIGGTIHVALGSSFAELGGQNESKLHWDLICDLRAEGEVYADGELVWKQGRFLDGAGG
jgi:aminopeptidase